MEAEVRESRKALQAALNIGAQMLSSGAEISRVEDSIVIRRDGPDFLSNYPRNIRWD